MAAKTAGAALSGGASVAHQDTGTLAWPHDFTILRPIMSEAVRQQICHELMKPADGLFVAKGNSAIVLSESSTAGAWLGSMAECGEAGCACSRLAFPTVRPRFRSAISQHTPREVHYVSLASGQLLADADILAALLDGGAEIRSISLIDAGYARTNNQRDVAALRQLAALAHPARVTAFDSVGSYAESCGARANVLVANDPATTMALVFKRLASHALIEGGHAFLLLNGGQMGASVRVWRRVTLPQAANGRGLPTTSPECDAALGLEEVDVEGATPANDGGEQRLREIFDRDALEDICEHMRVLQR